MVARRVGGWAAARVVFHNAWAFDGVKGNEACS